MTYLGESRVACNLQGSLVYGVIYEREKSSCGPYSPTPMTSQIEANEALMACTEISKIARMTFLDLMSLFSFSLRMGSHAVPLDYISKNDSHGLNQGIILSLFYSTITEERHRVLRLLQPMLSTYYRAYFKKPRLNSLRNTHLEPFSLPLWTVVAASSVLLCLTLALLHDSTGEGRKCLRKDEVTFNWIWIPLVIIDNESFKLYPCSWTARMILALGTMVGLVTHIFYTSHLLSSIVRKISPISSLSDLIGHGFIFTTHEKSQPLQQILKGLIADHKLGQRLELIDTSLQITHLLQSKVKGLGPYATITYTDAFQKAASSQGYSRMFQCQVLASLPISQWDRPTPSSFVMQKSADPKFSRLNIITERGLNRRYFRDFDSDNKEERCLEQKATNVVNGPVHIEDAFFPITAIAGGLALSTVLLVLENIIKIIMTLWLKLINHDFLH